MENLYYNMSISISIPSEYGEDIAFLQADEVLYEDRRILQIVGIHVKKDYRLQGIATSLIKTLIEKSVGCYNSINVICIPYKDCPMSSGNIIIWMKGLGFEETDYELGMVYKL